MNSRINCGIKFTTDTSTVKSDEACMASPKQESLQFNFSRNNALNYHTHPDCGNTPANHQFTTDTSTVKSDEACMAFPQAGIIANQLLKKRLATYGCVELPHTPGLWKHTSKPSVWFYKVTIDYKGSLYCGVTLEWNYEQRYVDISMPGYVKKLLIKYKHPTPTKPVHTPWEPQPF
jgi:hypothetical protein